MPHKPTDDLTRWLYPVSLLWVIFSTRLFQLTQLPLHNDEGLHLTRAIAVWRGHPFWDITDGKIINHWPIALFYPQVAPDFIARMPTVFLAVLGVAAGFALMRRLVGTFPAWVAGLFWVLSPYLFFYERLGQSDAEAGAWVVVAVWATWRWTQSQKIHFAVFGGVALALAVLFKFTAAPYALVIALMVGFMGQASYRTRFYALSTMAIIGFVAFLPPLLYLMLQGSPLFNIALGWIGGGSGDGTIATNVLRFGAQIVGFGSVGVVWLVLIVLGWLLALMTPALRSFLLVAWIPLALIIVLSNMIFPRHFVVTLPLLLLIVGTMWGGVLMRLPIVMRWTVVGVWVALNLPFMWTAYTQPAALSLSDLARREFIQDHGSGYGLREAMLDLPALVGDADMPIVASMFPASCRRANFYADPQYTLMCVDAPGLERIAQELLTSDEVFVLADRLPGIGVSRVDELGRGAEIVRLYPRPDETPETASIVLYRVTAQR